MGQDLTRAELCDFIEGVYGGHCGVLLADGFEGAFLGVAAQFSKSPCAVYDKSECIEILMKRASMSEEDALEYFDYNVQGAWVGDQTPMFLLRAPWVKP